MEILKAAIFCFFCTVIGNLIGAFIWANWHLFMQLLVLETIGGALYTLFIYRFAK